LFEYFGKLCISIVIELLKRDSLTLKINMLSMFLFSTEEDISYLYVSIEEQEITTKDIKT
jgi:hypothetical protein